MNDKKYNVIKKYNDGSITFTKAKLNYRERRN